MKKIYRFAVMSDLHLEFWFLDGLGWIRKLRNPGVDGIILAGDICGYPLFGQVFDAFLEVYPKIIFVNGNHEYYGQNRDKIQSTVQGEVERLRGKLIYLQNNTVILDGQLTILGGTLWFQKSPAAIRLAPYFSDFSYIQKLEDWVFQDNAAFRDLLAKMKPDKCQLVISHHAPSHRSTDPRYSGDESNCFFSNDLDDEIRRVKPRVWVHGHIHHPWNYTIGDTRIIANPYGYKKERQGFDETCVIEVPV